MASYGPGTLLTCVHDGCPCRVRVEVECHCPDGAGAYRCTCGAEMVAVDESDGSNG
jgi:metallothionein